jgi:CRISPR-associated endonuclease/helicase Cas3
MDKCRDIDKYALAKSHPEEDIQTHTDSLLNNLECLKAIYPNLFADWDKLYELLRLACIYHDMGKLYPRFQHCIRNRISYDGIPHGLLSLAFIDYKLLKKGMGLESTDLKLLYQAVAYHHDRKLPHDNKDIDEELYKLKEPLERFIYKELPSKYCAKEINRRYFKVGARFTKEDEEKDFFRFIMLKGLLNRLDYAASAHVEVEYPNTFLVYAMNNLMERWQRERPESQWNEMQRYMLENSEKNVIVIAQTGMGKTEAGLLWLGNSKGFFTLPLKSAINAIYARIVDDIVLHEKDKRVGMLHSETYTKYLERSETEQQKTKEIEKEEISTELYYTRTKQLSLPLTVCTLDQLFTFVFLYRGFEYKPATLAYSKIIIDEVQMYSPELMAYLVLGLRYISRLGGKFAILTATLPAFFVDLLREQNIPFEAPCTFTDSQIRHSLKVIDKEINAEDIVFLSQKYKGKKILVICNTVKSAVNLYNQLQWDKKKKQILLRDSFPNDDESTENYKERQGVYLFHNCFIKADRAKKETHILSMGQSKSNESGIWITTQIVEASLDIDFDLLFTELSDLNGLFQRMGRCYRKRDLVDQSYNCFVFTGGNKLCSGVGAFINKEIHKLSKEALLNVDGVIGEKEKVDMIERLYTKEKLPEYYEMIKSNLEYVDSRMVGELGKAEAQEIFRDIDTVSIVPRKVYEAHHDDIKKAMEILQNDFRELERDKVREMRAKARRVITDHTVDISRYLFRNIETKSVRINDHEQFVIAECDYNSQVGIIRPTFVKNSEITDFSSRSF